MRELGSAWAVVESAAYRAEAELQQLLGESPSLLPVDEMRPGMPDLVAAVREFPIPGSGSADLLAFTAEGHIVLVECKLSANPDIKRKVVGQLLEYAGFLWQMSYEELVQRIEARSGTTLVEWMNRRADTDESWNEQAFRQVVTGRLKRGDFLLVIVVDEATPELMRAAEFLNGCTTSGFSFHVVEMQRFQRGHTEILLPHLHGSTVQPDPEPREEWSKERFLRQLQERVSPEVARTVEGLYDWSEEKADRVVTGRGKTGSFSFHYVSSGRAIPVFAVYTNARLELHFDSVERKAGIEIVRAFHNDLLAIPGFEHIPPDFSKWPSVEIGRLTSSSIEAFKRAMEKLGEAIHGAAVG